MYLTKLNPLFWTNQDGEGAANWLLKTLEQKDRELHNLWLDIQFLDKYSEDEHYWNKEMGNNHTVEMHISDFERLRKAITPQDK